MTKADTRHKSKQAGNLRQLIRFSASSAVTTITDFLCFTLLYSTSSYIVLSNVGARVVSASVNFLINRRMVFQDDTDIKKTAVKFFASAAAILAVKTTILKILADVLGLNAYLSKGVIGAAFFFVNWLIQRLVVFAEPPNPQRP